MVQEGHLVLSILVGMVEGKIMSNGNGDLRIGGGSSFNDDIIIDNDGLVSFFGNIELNGSSTRQIRFDDGAVSEGAIVFDEITNGFIFKVGGTSGAGKKDAFKIDNQGNIGIGVTPDDEWDTFTCLQIGEVGSLYMHIQMGLVLVLLSTSPQMPIMIVVMNI